MKSVRSWKSIKNADVVCDFTDRKEAISLKTLLKASNFERFFAGGGKTRAASAIGTLLLLVQASSLSMNAQLLCISCEPTNPLAGLSSPQSLLVIAPDGFLPALEPLVQHKNSTGMPTVAISISSIAAYFPGADDPERIKRAIQYAHEHLETQYVMLVGDAHSFPVRYEFFWGLTSYDAQADGDYIPSDLYYANLYHHLPWPVGDIFDNWDANGDGRYNESYWEANSPNPDNVDGYPDVAVGRVPAHTPADVTTYVNKIIFYETQTLNHWLFTFVGDYKYQPINISTNIVTASGLKAFEVFPLINSSPDPPSPWYSATTADVAAVASASTWVSYVGHGWQHGWDGPDADLVQAMANNTALPVVFAAGCSTGAFAPEAPGVNTYRYQDVSGQLHRFITEPGDSNGPWILDEITGKTWGDANCLFDCSPLPMTTPKPNPYDFDESDFGFAYPWLIQYPSGGAIAYFGEVSVAIDSMGAELETNMLQDYEYGDRILGSIFLTGQRKYYQNHFQLNNGVPANCVLNFQNQQCQLQAPPRIYLGWMVFYGDPSLRMY